MKRKLLSFLVASALGTGVLCAQEIAKWEDFKKTAVTFTFDDAANEVSSHSWAVQQLDKHGFKATFYMVTNWAGSNWGTYKGFAQKGHEIGSHTTNHDAYSGHSESKSIIEQNIGQPCLTIAYPNCNNPGNSILNYYIGGRICGGQNNSSSPGNLTALDCSICGNQGINSSNGITSKCQQANGGWAVFLIHGIQGYAGNGSYSPTDQGAFTGALDWLDSNKNDYWVCTFRDAIMYFRERDNAEIKKISSDSKSDTYSLTLSSELTNNKICKWDYPLTIKVPVQNGWSDIKVLQNDEEIESSVSGGYVYFKAVPNGGNIVVGSAAPAIPDPEFTLTTSDKSETWCKDSSYTITWTMKLDSQDPGERSYTLNWGTGSSSTEISISNVSASSEWGENGNAYWTVDKILSDDGQHGGSSRWGSMTGTDEYVVFDLGKTQTVGGVKIDECTEYDQVSSFEIQYDENGSWKTAFSGTTIGHDFSKTFSPVSTSKMRLFIKSAGEGCNINYVEFSGVAGFEIKTGIKQSGSVNWKPNTTGAGMITITNDKGKALASTSAITLKNCGTTEEPGDQPGDQPGGSTTGGTFFDEDGAYFGPDCDATNYTGAYYTGNYTSPFITLLGKTESDIQKKLDQMWSHYFENGSNKVYTDRGNGEAYILDTGNNDVRSEGMSYGMMISVQTNHPEHFKKLWQFAKSHMWHNPNNGGDGYFSWQVGTDGGVKDQGCAPDGEMYFMTSLLFAAHRWNNSEYMKDAQAILKSCWKGNGQSLFNEQYKVVTFQPSNGNNSFSDPSYDLPAFVDLFSRWSDTNKDKWSEAAKATRDHLYKSSNSQSGLFSDYNNFDGTPHGVSFNSNAEKYMYDAMRCAMNFGMDYYLFGKDATRQEEMARRIIDFFEKDNYQHARFNWDGSNPSESYTLGETGANAVACYCLMNNSKYDDIVKKNLKKAWDAGLMTGQYRYYDGLVHYLSMLHLCGSFKIWKETPKNIKEKTVEGGEYLGVKYTEDTTIDSFEDCQLYKVTIKAGNESATKDVNNREGISIYPNPAENDFTIMTKEQVESIIITNFAGQIVSESANSNVQVSLSKGTYFVKVYTAEGNVYVEKLLIK